MKQAPRNSSPQLQNRFHLLAGDDEVAMELAKSLIVDHHLSPEMREENYREFLTTPGTPLKRVLDDVMAELATVSFLPDAPRVVTLYTVSDLLEGKSKGAKSKKSAAPAGAGKTTASEILTQFLENDLAHIHGVLILMMTEDPEKGKRLDYENPVVQYAAQKGFLTNFRDESPQFAFFDALFARDAEKAIPLWREWIQRAGSSNNRPYQMLISQFRLLIQAKILGARTYESRKLSRTAFEELCLPKEYDRTILRVQPESRRERLQQQASKFSYSQLNRATQRLMPLVKTFIPLSTDITVPNKSHLAEIWILELCLGD
jgi:DNA polymerase III delta subunit